MAASWRSQPERAQYPQPYGGRYVTVTAAAASRACHRHHRAVHEEGYQLARQPDGELQSRRPNGWILPDVPPPPKVPDEPVKLLRALNDAEGLVLHAHTATPGWLGERLDVVYAIDVLHPLAISSHSTR